MIELKPLEKKVIREVSIPSSKSYTNRALIMGALTRGSVTLHNPLFCEDTEAMISGLRTLGIVIKCTPGQIIVEGDIFAIKEGSYELFAHDSGTTMRFLLALLCIVPGTKILKGNRRLNERPIHDLVDALRKLGAKIHYLEKEGEAPLQITSSTLSAKRVSLNSSISSQFLSSLLMIAPLLEGITIALQNSLPSKPYVDMTVKMMQEWNINVLQKENEFTIQKQHYKKNYYTIEGDFSSAGYFFAMAALTNSTLSLKNLNPASAQADRKFLTLLEKMGNKVYLSETTITLIGKQILPLSIDMEECPDQVQTMAVLAAFAKGVTTLSGVRSLRVKETERVQALKNELAKMGIKTEDSYDSLTIYGGNPHAAEIETYGDHRMAMAFAVAGTKLSGMKIKNPSVVNKTFPDFWKMWGSL